MRHQPFPVAGFEFMNEPATEDQKKMFLELAEKLDIKLDPNGAWPEPFTKWDAKCAIEALIEKLDDRSL